MRLKFKGRIFFCPQFPIDQIHHQVDRLRHAPGLLAKLKRSMEVDGLLNPLIGETLADGRVQVGPGKQRLKAAIELGWEEVDVLVWDRYGVIQDLDLVEWIEVAPEVDEIMCLFTDDHEVDLMALRKGNLAIKKTINWRDKR